MHDGFQVVVSHVHPFVKNRKINAVTVRYGVATDSLRDHMASYRACLAAPALILQSIRADASEASL